MPAPRSTAPEAKVDHLRPLKVEVANLDRHLVPHAGKHDVPSCRDVGGIVVSPKPPADAPARGIAEAGPDARRGLQTMEIQRRSRGILLGAVLKPRLAERELGPGIEAETSASIAAADATAATAAGRPLRHDRLACSRLGLQPLEASHQVGILRPLSEAAELDIAGRLLPIHERARRLPPNAAASLQRRREHERQQQPDAHRPLPWSASPHCARAYIVGVISPPH